MVIISIIIPPHCCLAQTLCMRTNIQIWNAIQHMSWWTRKLKMISLCSLFPDVILTSKTKQEFYCKILYCTIILYSKPMYSTHTAADILLTMAMAHAWYIMFLYTHVWYIILYTYCTYIIYYDKVYISVYIINSIIIILMSAQLPPTLYLLLFIYIQYIIRYHNI